MVLLLIVHGLSHTSDRAIFSGLPILLFFMCIPFLNRAGRIDSGRTMLTIGLIVGTLAMTLSRKLLSTDGMSISTFYQSRTGILVFSIIPFATIHFLEKKLLFLNVLICFLGLVLFDPIHNFFGVGFYQLGHNDSDYYYGNVIFSIIYFILTGCIIVFKRTIDKYEHENENLINSLHTKTLEMKGQKEELETQGDILKELLLEKDKDLSKVTAELIKFNHDLLQYSYTISHNLRGPVARTLGLLDLLRRAESEEEKKLLADYILTSTLTLDEIIHDLNKIIEVQGDSYMERENILFDELLDRVKVLLAIPIRKYGIRINKEFTVSGLFTAQSHGYQILFNTISNAIQFRRDSTAPEVFIRTYRQGAEVVLEVKDNGRGMDLPSIGDKLFKPFNRFHPEVSGKGVGLFLVKLQVDRLHGRVEVKSKHGVGTTITFYLKDWNDEK